MTTELAFVGDIHGNLRAVQGLWELLLHRDAKHVLFLGDYINKGRQSPEVVQELVSYSASGRATLLMGNHEEALLDALDREDLSAFLKMGGASTIRSYLHGDAGPDVFADFAASIPPAHVAALRRMPSTFETDDVIAQHTPSRPTSKFLISAHVPVGDVPRIGHHSAQLDTGCGAGAARLSALLWPSREYVQVDNTGVVVER